MWAFSHLVESEIKQPRKLIPTHPNRDIAILVHVPKSYFKSSGHKRFSHTNIHDWCVFTYNFENIYRIGRLSFESF